MTYIQRDLEKEIYKFIKSKEIIAVVGPRQCGKTTMVKNIMPGTGGSSPSNLLNVGGIVYFASDNGTNGVELWSSNGTAAGTAMVDDINPGANSSLPSNLTDVGGTVYFASNDGTSGVELWKSDGTGPGTVMM